MAVATNGQVISCVYLITYFLFIFNRLNNMHLNILINYPLPFQLFAWGCGSNGRLGLKAFFHPKTGSKRRLKCYVSTPSEIESLQEEKVISVSAGKYWSFAIVENRNIP